MNLLESVLRARPARLPAQISAPVLDSARNPASSMEVRWSDGFTGNRPRQLVMGICPS